MNIYPILISTFSFLISVAIIIYKAGILTNRQDNHREAIDRNERSILTVKDDFIKVLTNQVSILKDNIIRNEEDIRSIKKDMVDTLKRLHDRIDTIESGYIKTDQCKDLRDNMAISYGQNSEMICNLMKRLDERMEKIENKVELQMQNLQKDINNISKKINSQ